MVKSDLISGLKSGCHIWPGPDMAGYENLVGFRPGPDMISGATLVSCIVSVTQAKTSRIFQILSELSELLFGMNYREKPDNRKTYTMDM